MSYVNHELALWWAQNKTKDELILLIDRRGSFTRKEAILFINLVVGIFAAFAVFFSLRGHESAWATIGRGVSFAISALLIVIATILLNRASADVATARFAMKLKDQLKVE